VGLPRRRVGLGAEEDQELLASCVHGVRLVSVGAVRWISRLGIGLQVVLGRA
jgi:hypothetical protein